MWRILKRWRLTLIVAFMLLLGLGFAFWPEATAVDMARISRGPMEVGVIDDGVTRAQEYYVVSAPVTGYISRIELDAGDIVSEGTLITRMTGRPSAPLDPRSERELRSALSSAEAVVQGLRDALDQSRRDLARSEELAQRGFLPKAQLEAARTRVSIGEASLAQSRAEVARISAMLSQPTQESRTAVPVRAPVSGSVLSVITESEGVIAEGTPLITIGDPRRIEVVVDLLSRDAVQVRSGDRVEITQWGGAEPITGRVQRVEPFGRLKISALGIEEQRVVVIVDISSSDAESARLGHGYQVDATIVLWSNPAVLRVPIGALFRGQDGGWRVFTSKGGRARERAVRIGHFNDEYGEVISGLETNEEVIVDPGPSLRDGARVRRR